MRKRKSSSIGIEKSLQIKDPIGRETKNDWDRNAPKSTY